MNTFNTKFKKISWIDISVYISTLLFLTSTVILPRVFDMTGDFASYINLLKIISMLYNFSMFVVFVKTSIKNILVIFFIFILSLGIQNMSFLNYLLYVLALYSYGNNTRNFKAYLQIKTLLLLLVLLFGVLGMNSEYTLIGDDRKIRYTLGFTNPNTASMVIFDIIIGIIYIYKGKLSIVIVSVLIGLLTFKFTDSRTLLMALSLMVILLLFNNITIKKLKQVIINTSIICLVLTGVLMSFHDTELNLILNRRPQMAYDFINYYTPNLLGYSKNDLVISVDNSYLRILIELGTLYFITHLILIKKIFINLFDNKDYLGIKVIIVVLIYDIFEQFTIAHGSILLVFIAQYLINRRKNKYESR